MKLHTLVISGPRAVDAVVSACFAIPTSPVAMLFKALTPLIAAVFAMLVILSATFLTLLIAPAPEFVMSEKPFLTPSPAYMPYIRTVSSNPGSFFIVPINPVTNPAVFVNTRPTPPTAAITDPATVRNPPRQRTTSIMIRTSS
ncbi:Uncharacterised protein [Hungatella hathewayi]|uniref:Uncharacterized protein n=1 Tax=Hungatella hathewayi TaxID=154046 RepID=A0A6N3I4I5_9FIRM